MLEVHVPAHESLSRNCRHAKAFKRGVMRTNHLRCKHAFQPVCRGKAFIEIKGSSEPGVLCCF